MHSVCIKLKKLSVMSPCEIYITVIISENAVFLLKETGPSSNVDTVLFEKYRSYKMGN